MLLHAETLGRGAPVALLHGLFGRGRNLAAVARSLAPACRVITLDLRNHGASPHAAGMDYPLLAADVLETLGAMDALPASLLGHSMGGKTAMACALLAPGAVHRLLVADIAPVAYAHHNRAIAEAMLALPLAPGLTRAAASAALQAAVPDPAVRNFLLQNLLPGDHPQWSIGLAHIAAAMAGIEGWQAAGAAFQGPALFVAGERSDYVTDAGKAAARALFPQARFMALEAAGHWLHAEQPAAFAQIAVSFLCPPARFDDAAIGEATT